MSFWQVQIHQTTIWIIAGRWYVYGEKINKIFKNLPNVFDTEDDTLLVTHDTDGTDHDITFRQEMQIYCQENIKTK